MIYVVEPLAWGVFVTCAFVASLASSTSAGSFTAGGGDERRAADETLWEKVRDPMWKTAPAAPVPYRSPRHLAVVEHNLRSRRQRLNPLF